MKTITKILAAFIALLLVVIACNRTEDSEFNTNSGLDGASDRVVSHKVLKINPDNKYNIVGELHNEIATTYLNKYGKDKTKDLDVIAERTKEIALSNSKFVRIMKENNERPDFSSAPQKAGIKYVETRFREPIAKLRTGEKTREKITELVNYFYDKAEGNKEPSYEEVDKYLAGFEKNVIQNEDKLSENDQKRLLMTVAVARHSNNLWYNYYMIDLADDNITGKRSFWSWCFVVVSDAVGAFFGVSIAPESDSSNFPEAQIPVGGVTVHVGTSVNASMDAYEYTGNK